MKWSRRRRNGKNEYIVKQKESLKLERVRSHKLIANFQRWLDNGTISMANWKAIVAQANKRITKEEKYKKKTKSKHTKEIFINRMIRMRLVSIPILRGKKKFVIILCLSKKWTGYTDIYDDDTQLISISFVVFSANLTEPLAIFQNLCALNPFFSHALWCISVIPQFSPNANRQAM